MNFLNPIDEEEDHDELLQSQGRQQRTPMAWGTSEHMTTSSTSYSINLGALPTLVFFGFLAYAVGTSHTDAVTDACGTSLWVYMLTRLLLLTVGSFFYICPIVLLNMCCNSMPVAALIIMIVSCSTMLGVGVPIVTGALASPGCVAALSASCFTNSPMLAIIGCILIGFDALVLLLLIGVCLIIIGFGSMR